MWDVQFWALQSLASGLLNLIVAIYVLYKAPKRELNRVFALYASLLAIWGLSEFGHRYTHDPDAARFWILAGGLGWCLMFSPYFHFALIFARKEDYLNRWATYVFLYLPGFLFLFLFLGTELIFQHDLVMKEWGFTLKPGSFAWSFLFYYLCVFFLTTCLFAKVFRNGSYIEKKQSKPIIIGSSLFLIGGSATNLAFPHFGIASPETGTLLSTLWMLCILYAVRKHQLFIVVPSSEKEKKQSFKYELARGASYFIWEEGVRRSYEIFNDQISGSVFGLWFSRFSPAKMREKGLLPDTAFVWVNPKVKGKDTVSPHALDSIQMAISDFLHETKRSVVLIDCFSEIRLANGFEKAKSWLKAVKAECDKAKSNLLVTLSPFVFEREECLQLDIRELCND